MSASTELKEHFGVLKMYFDGVRRGYPEVQPIVSAIDRVTGPAAAPFREGQDGRILQDAQWDNATYVLLQLACVGITAKDPNVESVVKGSLPVARDIKSLLGLSRKAAPAPSYEPHAINYRI